MKKWKIGLVALVPLIWAASPAQAQLGGLGGVGGAAGAGAGAAGAGGVAGAAGAAGQAGAAAGQAGTIWQSLGLSKEQLEKCRQKLCKKPIGRILNGMTLPLSFATGGLIGPLCPTTPSAEDLAKGGAEGAAAAIKADAAEAKARRAAVRFLGTVNCKLYDEAEPALITALRTDRVECVRFEAALALQSGCCCTKKVIATLAIVVAASDEDGNPKETSERVRMAALCALNHCLACVDHQDKKEVFEALDKVGSQEQDAKEKTARRLRLLRELARIPEINDYMDLTAVAEADALESFRAASTVRQDAYPRQLETRSMAQISAKARALMEREQAALAERLQDQERDYQQRALVEMLVRSLETEPSRVASGRPVAPARGAAPVAVAPSMNPVQPVNPTIVAKPQHETLAMQLIQMGKFAEAASVLREGIAREQSHRGGGLAADTALANVAATIAEGDLAVIPAVHQAPRRESGNAPTFVQQVGASGSTGQTYAQSATVAAPATTTVATAATMVAGTTTNGAVVAPSVVAPATMVAARNNQNKTSLFTFGGSRGAHANTVPTASGNVQVTPAVMSLPSPNATFQYIPSPATAPAPVASPAPQTANQTEFIATAPMVPTNVPTHNVSSFVPHPSATMMAANPSAPAVAPPAMPLFHSGQVQMTANAYWQQGHHGEAITLLRNALRQAQQMPPAQAAPLASQLALALATCPQPQWRKPDEAMQWAFFATQNVGPQRPYHLQTLAVVHAMTGNTTYAAQIARVAAHEARAYQQHDLAKQIEARFGLIHSAQANRFEMQPLLR